MNRLLWIIPFIIVLGSAASSFARPLGCSSSSPSGLDTDCDGVADEEDNCVNVPNGDCTIDDPISCDIDDNGTLSEAELEGGGQRNTDLDDEGDACDDRDGDNLIDIFDSCPDVQNPTQQGPDDFSACTDKDFDGQGDSLDNCPSESNPDQKNRDGDTLGDACDKCIFTIDTGADSDGDGIGDACENDIDNDTIRNERDNCPAIPNRDQLDRDQDKVGDACDNCPNISNTDQENICPDPSVVPGPQPAEDILGGLPEQRELVSGSGGCTLSAATTTDPEPISGFLGLMILVGMPIGFI